MASDVLLYVRYIHPMLYVYIYISNTTVYSAYPALVLTLSELFDAGTVQEFLMSWNRRIPESALFFANMKEAGICSHNRKFFFLNCLTVFNTVGFLMVHHGKCVYSFYRTLPPGVTASPDFGVVA